MRRNQKGISKIIILIFVVAVVAIGCTPARRPIDERDRVDINQERINGNGLNDLDTENEENVYDDYDLGFDNVPNNMDLSYNLAQNIRNINGIGDAVIITDNNTAYVGLAADNGINQNDLRQTQAEVAKRIREQAPEVERVYVTSDMARVEEIRKLSRRLTNGESRKDIVNELERLFS